MSTLVIRLFGSGWAKLLTAILAISVCLGMVPYAMPATEAATPTVQRGFFYVPPDDGTSVQTLAKTANFMILSGTNNTYRNQLRSAGYTGAVLQYLLSDEVDGPGPYKNSSASCNSNYDPLSNNVARFKGDFCKYIHPHEDWFLHNGAGARLYSTQGSHTFYAMNPASAGWRAFVSQRMLTDITTLGYNGLFLDNVELGLLKKQQQLPDSDGVVKEYSTDTAYINAWVSYLQYLGPILRPHGQIWANFISGFANWDPYLANLDGGMFEAFATGFTSNGLSVTKWEGMMEQAERALGNGKGILAVGQGSQSDLGQQKFALASYLLVANSQNSYFRYAKAHDYSSWWNYDDYNIALGAAKGKRYQTGSSWRRDYACGYVTVDPAAQTGNIVQTSCSTSGTTTDDSTGGTTGGTTGGSTGGTTATTSKTFTASADAYVDSSAASRNFGASQSLEADGQPNRISYLRFNVSNLSGSVVSAKLRLYATDKSGQAGGGTLFQTSSTGWNETGVTYNTRPSTTGSAIGSLGQVQAGQWYEIDVTDAITGNDTYSFALTGNAIDGAGYASRESGSHAPQLVVTTK